MSGVVWLEGAACLVGQGVDFQVLRHTLTFPSAPIVVVPELVGWENLTVIRDLFPSEVLVLLVIHRPIARVIVVKVAPASAVDAVIARGAWCAGDAIFASKST
jgi:hypothetical protein